MLNLLNRRKMAYVNVTHACVCEFVAYKIESVFRSQTYSHNTHQTLFIFHKSSAHHVDAENDRCLRNIQCEMSFVRCFTWMCSGQQPFDGVCFHLNFPRMLFI